MSDQDAVEVANAGVRALLGDVIASSGLTYSEVGKRLGLSRQQIHDYVSPRLEGRGITVRTLARVLWACEQELVVDSIAETNGDE